MKDECKAQSSPAGIRCRYDEADDFASGRALAYESRRFFRARHRRGGNPGRTSGCGADLQQGMR
jgi:hypothetical protein